MLRKLGSKKQQGFTLIELMIVIAIIGILAAIAIPQFVKYRIQSFNSSALSDVRNLFTSQEALFADWRVYGNTSIIAPAAAGVEQLWNASGGGPGAALLGPTGSFVGGNFIPIISADDPTDATLPARGTKIPVGNQVTIVATTNAGAIGVGNQTFTCLSKHRQGDTYYGVDSDVTAVYFERFSPSVGIDLAGGEEPDPQASIDDFADTGSSGGIGPQGTDWIAR